MPDFSGLPLVIEPDDLLARLDAPHLIVVDLTSAARHDAGHIPGAHFVDPKRTQLGQPPAPGLLPTHTSLEALFGELGHTANAVYVVYDDEGGGWPGWARFRPRRPRTAVPSRYRAARRPANFAPPAAIPYARPAPCRGWPPAASPATMRYRPASASAWCRAHHCCENPCHSWQTARSGCHGCARWPACAMTPTVSMWPAVSTATAARPATASPRPSCR